jgi:phosphatidate cytidylyltransferase
MSPIVRRVITGVVLSLFWFGVIISQQSWLAFGAFALAILVCHFEFAKMIEARGIDTCRKSGAIAAFAYLLHCFAFPNNSYLVAALIIFVLFVRLLFDPKVQRPLESAAFAVLSFIYIPFMLSFFLRIAQEGVTQPFHVSQEGFFAVLYVVVVTKATDVGGYAIGIPFGKHKMFPRISPNKSWEGLIGGLIFSALFSVFFLWLVHPDKANIKLVHLASAAGVGSLLGIVGVLGDLIESMFKRSAEMKDSGGVFHGIGGLLDTFDSLIFTPVVFYLFLKFMP